MDRQVRGILIQPSGVFKVLEYRESVGLSPPGSRLAPTIKDCLNGGYLEVVRCRSDLFFYVDEDGKWKNLPLNDVATKLFAGALACFTDRAMIPGDYMVGPVLVAAADWEGAAIDLGDSMLKFCRDYLARVGGREESLDSLPKA